jgi:glycosyltransferase involved in cell wall biosynthesis
VNVTLVVDALSPQLSGIGRYVWELCSRVPLELSVDAVGYFANGRLIDDPRPLLAGEAGRDVVRVPRWLRPRFIRRRLRNDIVHGPNYFLPTQADCGIITVHDLSVFRYPETHPADRIRDFERQFQHSLDRATHVITDSETIRQEVLREFGLDQRNVTAIPLGVSPQFHARPAAEVETELRSFGLVSGKYALCVSTLEPRKKIAELVAAWGALPEPLRRSNPLVLAGAKGWLNDNLHNAISDGVAGGWLKHCGFVRERSLPALYAGASLFVYPSIYEGFGLPPLEAMASAVPVLASDTSCAAEVCGNAAAYANPDDFEGFRSGITRALTDSRWRAEARSKGIERASAFSWEKCVAQTVAVYARGKC